MQKTLLHSVFNKLKGKTFAVTYWDGETKVYGTERNKEYDFHLIVSEKLDIKDILRDPEIKCGEAYMDKKFEFEGDLRDGFSVLIQNADFLTGDKDRQGMLIKRFIKRQQKKPRENQVQELQHHYDLGNDFFRLWLDETMSYSCAYFHNPGDSLQQAQLQKIGYILRKLQLKKGETLLDIGCGWGSLVIRAAALYDINALGITLSKDQQEEAQKRIMEADLQDKVEVRMVDYRDLSEEKLSFDKIVSVGMFEHVGKKNIPEYFKCIKKMLKPQGLSLLHSITHPTETHTNPWLEKYIFPWGYVPSLREIIHELPENSFHIIDIESLRLHYAMTLDHWAENFEKIADIVKDQYGEKFVRMWRIYLYGCASFFRYTGLDIHQILFTNGPANELPLTRKHLYRPSVLLI